MGLINLQQKFTRFFWLNKFSQGAIALKHSIHKKGSSFPLVCKFLTHFIRIWSITSYKFLKMWTSWLLCFQFTVIHMGPHKLLGCHVISSTNFFYYFFFTLIHGTCKENKKSLFLQDSQVLSSSSSSGRCLIHVTSFSSPFTWHCKPAI